MSNSAQPTGSGGYGSDKFVVKKRIKKKKTNIWKSEEKQLVLFTQTGLFFVMTVLFTRYDKGKIKSKTNEKIYFFKRLLQ